MIKKHQTWSTYVTYQRISLKKLLQKIFELATGNPDIIEEKLRNRDMRKHLLKLSVSLTDKVINIIQLLVQSDGKTYCCC